MQQWLAPGNPAACVANPTTLCLNDGRFRVTVFYATPDGASGPGHGRVPDGRLGLLLVLRRGQHRARSSRSSTRCTLGNFWVFAGGLTNVGVTLLVEDTQTGASKTYNNPIGTPFAPLQDTQAFSCP